MSDEDVLCEAAGPGGMTCDLPYGHKPENVHRFSIELPAHIGAMIDEHVSQLEDAQRRLERNARLADVAKWAMFIATALNLGAMAINLMN